MRVVGLVQVAQWITFTEAGAQEGRAASIEGVADADTTLSALSDGGVEPTRKDLGGAVVDEGPPADDG